MRQVPVHEAVGMVLGHDLTEILPGVRKGPAFKKGQIITEADIPRLLNMGKEHIYIFELEEGHCHENDAAIRIANAIAGQGITLTEPSEGKVELKASCDGVLKINIEAMTAINMLEDLVVASIHANRTVKLGMTLAGCRVVPLTIESCKIKEVEEIARKASPVFEVLPIHSKKVGVVTTGSEVYHGRIQDQFGPVIKAKLHAFGSEVIRQIFADDNPQMIADAIRELIDEGAEMIVTTGGMSVDPDDVTPTGIIQSGGKVIAYGAPVLPGSMFLLADLGGVPIMGLPGCVMYCRTTIFDILLPRILANETLTRKDLVVLGHGGLCLNCEVCSYPECSFGKGF